MPFAPFLSWIASLIRPWMPEFLVLPPTLLGIWLLVPTGPAQPLLDGGMMGGALGLLAISVAARRRVHRALWAARAALDHIDQAVMLIDQAGRVPLANRPALALLPALALQDVPASLIATRPTLAGLPRRRGMEPEPRLGDSPGESRAELVRPDGVVLEIVHRPLPDGATLRVLTDITRRQAAERQARFLADHDPLTGLINRRTFLELLERPVPRGAAQAVLFLDLARFRAINDSMGHHVGDPLLVAVAERLRQNMRPGDALARLGDDEFAVLLTEAASPANSLGANSLGIAQRLIQQLEAPYQVQGMRLTLGCHIGVALAPEHATGAALLHCADLALATAGHAGGLCLFEPEMAAQLAARKRMEQALRTLMDGDPASQMRLVYQPVVDTGSGAVVECEALLRWSHPVRGNIPPSDFIPIAEATGLILPLGTWVMEQACREAASWPLPIRVAVNLSPAQFFTPDLLAEIDAILVRTGLPAERLRLEVTEGLMIDDEERAVAMLEALHDRGVGLSLDDFGTGHASLARLRRFPFDTVKLDRSYIAAMAQDAETARVVAALLALADALRMHAVAEGVETEQQLEMLRWMGCALVQGYLTGRPQEADALRARLATESCAGANILPFPAPSVRLATQA